LFTLGFSTVQFSKTLPRERDILYLSNFARSCQEVFCEIFLPFDIFFNYEKKALAKTNAAINAALVILSYS